MNACRARHLTYFADRSQRCFAQIALLALTVFSLVIPQSSAAEPDPSQLKPETRRAFEHYVRVTDSSNETELHRGRDLLWVDMLPEVQRREAYAALLRGEVKIQKLHTSENGAPIACPNGLVHHWVAVAYIRGAKVDDVLAVLQDYDHHSTYFAPDVVRSKTLFRDEGHFRILLRFRRHKVITVVLNTEHDVHYFRDGPARAHSRSSAVRIAEVENPGKSDEREKPLGQDGGFLWAMETWWRMEERDGGVYVQSEVASLTRDIPTGLGWLIGPFVSGIPRETLRFTLEATRKAVVAGLRQPSLHSSWLAFS